MKSLALAILLVASTAAADVKSGDQGFEALGSHVHSTVVGGAGLKPGNKGFEAALTAIEMVNLLRQLP